MLCYDIILGRSLILRSLAARTTGAVDRCHDHHCDQQLRRLGARSCVYIGCSLLCEPRATQTSFTA